MGVLTKPKPIRTEVLPELVVAVLTEHFVTTIDLPATPSMIAVPTCPPSAAVI